ncbi:MAG: hypothetical protein M5E90_09190 [Asgard group archaeon]|nr:hypothetical protein [Asgard group archaeon]
MSQLTAKNSNQFAVKRKIEKAAKPKKKKKRNASHSATHLQVPLILSLAKVAFSGTRWYQNWKQKRKKKKKKETHHLIGHDFRLWSITYTSLK